MRCTWQSFLLCHRLSPPKNSRNTFPPPLKLFMCLVWTLLQVVVVFMYWDLPPTEWEKDKETPCRKREVESSEEQLGAEDNDEKQPLIQSREVVGSDSPSLRSNLPSYQATAASNETVHHIAAPPPSECQESSGPFTKCGMCRGEWSTVSFCGPKKNLKGNSAGHAKLGF